MNPNNSQEALAALQSQQSQAQNPNQILEAQRQQLGVKEAQDTLLGLRGAINNTTKLLKQVAPSVMGRTANSLVTNAQATKQISNEQAPISQNLTEQGTQYSQAGEDFNRLNQQATEAASGVYQGQQDKLSYLQNIYNSLYQREQAAEAARRAEQDRQEQIRQFNAQMSAAAKKSSGGGGFGIGGDVPASGGSVSKTDPAQQKAYNDVRTRIDSGAGRDALMSDYLATASSAKNGNKTDLYKLQLYRQLRPDIFKAKYQWEAKYGF